MFQLPQKKMILDGFLSGVFGAIGADRQAMAEEKIADENLEYQKERAEIEDARYEEETAYNRAFAEDERAYQREFAAEERDYQRALQQQIFDREDTAIARQAQSLASLGINPLSQKLEGLGAGQAISASVPGVGASAPSASSRSALPLHNDFKPQNKLAYFAEGLKGGLSSILGFADTMNGLQTGEYQRDALALQNDKQFLDNLQKANSLGIRYDGYFFGGNKKWTKEHNYRNSSNIFNTDDGTNLFDTPEFKQGLYSDYKKRYFDYMPNWAKTLEAVSNDNVYGQAERALTKMSNLFDKAYSNLFDKNEAKSMYDLGKGKNGKWNPYNILLNLFY